jgi:hypothetical protein
MEGRVSDRTVERCRGAALDAFRKHGELTTDPVRACAILIRECAEAMNEALTGTRPSMRECPISYQVMEHRIATRHLYIELSQVAAVAMMLMDQIEEAG